MGTYTLHKKGQDIYQYLDLNTKIKAKFTKLHKHLENFKISLTFLCVVYIYSAEIHWGEATQYINYRKTITLGANIICT